MIASDLVRWNMLQLPGQMVPYMETGVCLRLLNGESFTDNYKSMVNIEWKSYKSATCNYNSKMVFFVKLNKVFTTDQ